MPTRAVQTLQSALDDWHRVSPLLEKEYEALNRGDAEGTVSFDDVSAMAPLPRAWQWLDGSVYETHGVLMTRAFGVKAVNEQGRPLMYQGVSDRFLGPREDVFLPSASDGIDFEGEYGVIVDRVPMGTKAAHAAGYIRLVVQINDWSLRSLAPIEMKTGFGWVQAKPHSSMAPIAVTPDELEDAWRNCEVGLPLHVELNGERFGNARGSGMAFGFDELIEHAAYSRDLAAGTVIGSGTVSNPDFRAVGCSCIAERRAIEMIDHGEARTPFMSFGDRVRMEASGPNGETMFGAIDQVVRQQLAGKALRRGQ